MRQCQACGVWRPKHALRRNWACGRLNALRLFWLCADLDRCLDGQRGVEPFQGSAGYRLARALTPVLVPVKSWRRRRGRRDGDPFYVPFPWFELAVAAVFLAGCVVIGLVNGS